MSERVNLSASTREKIETALDKLIALLDAIDPDPDFEPWLAGAANDGGQDLEGDPSEEEPSLGATEALNQDSAWRAAVALGIDLEFDADTCPDADREPSLGSPEYLGLRSHANQEDWAGSRGGDDREFDTADDEPSLAAPERTGCQISWARGADDDCEAEHDGREPDEDREWDEAEHGIGDMDGAMEQFGIPGGLGERVEQ
ncbi:MAG: hypothetical protein WBL57_06095 [Methylovirgula sp.]